MAKQTSEGKAFEYGLAKRICDKYGKSLKAEDELSKYERYFHEISPEQRRIYLNNLDEMLEYLMSLDKNLRLCDGIVLASDQRSKKFGDNRDLLPSLNDKIMKTGGSSFKKNSCEVNASRFPSTSRGGNLMENWVGLYVSHSQQIYDMLEELSDNYKKYKHVPKQKKENLYILVMEYIESCLKKIMNNPTFVRRLFYNFVGWIGHLQVEYYEKCGNVYVRDFNYHNWSDSIFPENISDLHKGYNKSNVIFVGFDDNWRFKIRVKNGSSKITQSSIKFSITMEKCPIVAKIFNLG